MAGVRPTALREKGNCAKGQLYQQQEKWPVDFVVGPGFPQVAPLGSIAWRMAA